MDITTRKVVKMTAVIEESSCLALWWCWCYIIATNVDMQHQPCWTFREQRFG